MDIPSIVMRILGEFNQLGSRDVLSSEQRTRVVQCDGRFRLWSGSLGAHRKTGRRALEHRLRDSTLLRDNVLSLLTELEGLLDQAIDDDTTRDDSSSDLSDMSDTEAAAEIRKALETYAQRKGKQPAASDTSVILDQIENVVLCLMRLSVSIQNPQPFDHFKFRSHKGFDIEAAERATIRIEDNFPTLKQNPEDEMGQLTPRLAVHLGYANAERAAYFTYRSRHAVLLEEGLPDADDDNESLSRLTIGSQRSTTEASAVPQHFKDTPYPSAVTRYDGENNEDSLSQSTPTSHASDDKSDTPLRIPTLPPGTFDEPLAPIKCAYCHRFIVVGSNMEWRRHVYEDLRPYTCVIAGCSAPRRLYRKRREWRLHLEQAHWRVWPCPIGCPGTFSTAEEFRRHVSELHSDESAFNTESLFAMASHSSSVDIKQVPDTCLFCQKPVASVKSWVSHVGKHLEQISLFVLPRTILDYLNDGDAEDADVPGQTSSNFADSGDTTARADLPDSEVPVARMGYPSGTPPTPNVWDGMESFSRGQGEELSNLEDLEEDDWKAEIRQNGVAGASEAAAAGVGSLATSQNMSSDHVSPQKLRSHPAESHKNLGSRTTTHPISDSSHQLPDPSTKYDDYYGNYEVPEEDTDYFTAEENWNSRFQPSAVDQDLDLESDQPKYQDYRPYSKRRFLDSRFLVHSSRAFKPGMLLQTWWSGGVGRENASNARYRVDELTYAGIRNFLVVYSHLGSSTVVEMSANAGKGCAARGVISEAHGFIYDPDSFPFVIADESELGVCPVRAKMHQGVGSLGRAKRINYSKMHTLEHNVPVWFFGEVHTKDMKTVTDALRDQVLIQIEGSDGKSTTRGTTSHTTREKNLTESNKEVGALPSPVGHGSTGDTGTNFSEYKGESQKAYNYGIRYITMVNSTLTSVGYSETFSISSNTQLPPEYQIWSSMDFEPRRIIKTWWTEPRGAISFKRLRLDNLTYGGIRRFILLTRGSGHSLVIPITSYGRQGCSKKGVNPQNHGIIYNIRVSPQLLRGEPELGFPPVRADMYDDTDTTLTDASRINYAKIYTLEHNFPVAFIGEVDPNDFETVKNGVFSAFDGNAGLSVASDKESPEDRKARKHFKEDKKARERLKKA